MKKNEIKFIKKMSPTSSDVHVPATGEEDKIIKHKESVIEGLRAFINLFLNEESAEKAKLSTEGREHIKDSNFAIPSERKYPIHDESHARNAISRVSANGTEEEKGKVKAAVYRKYPSMRPVAKSEGVRRIATVAIIYNGKILMGKRRDNEKWTMPGGHLDPNETFKEGAIREALEESGIDISKELIVPLDTVQEVKSHKGDTIQVQPFKVDFSEKPKTTMSDDPDGEVYRWHWVDLNGGELVDKVREKMHTPFDNNVLIKSLRADKIVKDVEGSDAIPELNNYDVLGVMKSKDHTDNFMKAQELVSGMDYELERNKVVDPDIAREKAMEQMENDPKYYDKLWAQQRGTSDELAKDTEEGEQSDDKMGLNLDLGSGNARESGFLGVDSYPYDHGTIVHDLDLGIPFQTESASKVRLCNVQMEEEDIKPLLSEIQRVLMPGGQFVYEGPNDIYNYPEFMHELQDMVLVGHEEKNVNKAEGNPSTLYRQSFERVAVPDAATANDAEPRIGVAAYDMLPADNLIGMDALSYLYSDATSSGRGNRNHGYPSQGAIVDKSKLIAKIMKADKMKQIVYGVVLEPDSIDSQDDYMTPDDIEETAHNYMENFRIVGSQHSKGIQAVPVESYIAPMDLHFDGGDNGPQVVKKGSWILGVKVKDPKEWDKVMNGDYTGYSVGGEGYRQEI